MEIKDYIYSLRMEYGLTQQEFAYKCGVGKSTINMWESGKRTPSDRVLYKVAQTFNRVDDLKKYGLLRDVGINSVASSNVVKSSLAKSFENDSTYALIKNMRATMEMAEKIISDNASKAENPPMTPTEHAIIDAYRHSPSNIQNAVIALLGVSIDLEEDMERYGEI